MQNHMLNSPLRRTVIFNNSRYLWISICQLRDSVSFSPSSICSCQQWL